MSSVVPLRSSSCQSPDLVLPRPFPSVLTTRAFDHSRRRWFGTCSCQPVPRGPPSSIKQLHTLGPPRPFALVAHSRPRSSLFSPGTAPHVWSASTPSTSGSYRGSQAEDRSRPLVECRDRYPCRPLASSSPSHPVPQPALSTTSSPDAACACRRSSEPRTASARNVEWCQSISTDPRQRHPCSLRTAAYPLPESHPAHFSSAGTRKHSPPDPPQRSVPVSVLRRFAPPGPVLSGYQSDGLLRPASESLLSSPAVVDTFARAGLSPGRSATPSTPSSRCPRSFLRPRPERHGWPLTAPMPVAERLLGTPCRKADRSGIPARSSPFDTV